MHLLNTYETKDEAEEAAILLNGSTRVASERDDTATIYNLFGEATWKNLYSLKMYDLPKLKALLSSRPAWGEQEIKQHHSIILGLEIVSRKYGLPFPNHWK